MNDRLARPTYGETERECAVFRTGDEAVDETGNAAVAPGTVLGLPMLLELFDGSREDVAELLEAARASIIHDVLRIETAAGASDRNGLVEAAHRLKGTSGSISAQRLHVVSSSIERSARRGEAALVAPLLAELDAAAALTTAAIGSFAAGSGASETASAS